MKIKRYTAPSMRAALALVRSEQGPDAVILSSRRSDEGIEVIAAVDYDEALFSDATRQRAPAPSPEELAVAAAQSPHEPLISEAMREAALSVMAPPTRAAMTSSDKRLREPLQTRVLEELAAMDISPDVARALAEMTPQQTKLENPAHIPLALLCRHLPMLSDSTCLTGGVAAVVGPTGAGKTTTIAKLAARWCRQHGAQDLALVSTDGYRVGAREQLNSYARILGVPMQAANTDKELARVMEKFKSKKLILIDTAGMGPRDVRLNEQLSALRLGAACAKIFLALPAQGEGNALDEIVCAFAGIKPVASIITKVDEAASLGAVISATLRHKLKIAYLCNGQRVPGDLHAADQKRVWLVRTASDLKERSTPQRDEAYMARSFGQVPAHA